MAVTRELLVFFALALSAAAFPKAKHHTNHVKLHDYDGHDGSFKRKTEVKKGTVPFGRILEEMESAHADEKTRQLSEEISKIRLHLSPSLDGEARRLLRRAQLDVDAALFAGEHDRQTLEKKAENHIQEFKHLNQHNNRDEDRQRGSYSNHLHLPSSTFLHPIKHREADFEKRSRRHVSHLNVKASDPAALDKMALKDDVKSLRKALHLDLEQVDAENESAPAHDDDKVDMRVPSLESLAVLMKMESTGLSHLHSYKHNRNLEKDTADGDGDGDMSEDAKPIDTTADQHLDKEGLHFVEQMEEILAESSLDFNKKASYEKRLHDIASNLKRVSSLQGDERRDAVDRLHKQVKALHGLRRELESEMEPAKDADGETKDVETNVDGAESKVLEEEDDDDEKESVEKDAESNAVDNSDKESAKDEHNSLVTDSTGDKLHRRDLAEDDDDEEGKATQSADYFAALSEDHARSLEAVVEHASKLDDAKRNQLISNLQGIQRDLAALADGSLTQEQWADLEAALKLRMSMLQDEGGDLAKQLEEQPERE